MSIVLNNKNVSFSVLHLSDIDKLTTYLSGLGAETSRRFAPHPFDKSSLLEYYKDPAVTGYIAWDHEAFEIIGYFVVKKGLPHYDLARLRSYGLEPAQDTDSLFAPSIADQWQGKGLGIHMFQFMHSQLHCMHIKRIILWGGVQANNDKAIRYYHKLGFQTLGQFEHNGPNYDMLFEV